MAEEILPNPDSSDTTTHRMRWRDRVDMSALPRDLRALIAQVVQRTRLWKREKDDVAAELIAHFADGLATGITPADAIDAFGDPRTAAKLIRRSKIRSRPLVWYAWRWLRRGVGTVIVFYIAIAVYFYSGRPNSTVDYRAAYNAEVDRFPVSQQALPGYRALFLKWDAEKNDASNHSFYGSAKPGDPEWPKFLAWSAAHSSDIAHLRELTQRPALGLTIDGPPGAPMQSFEGPMRFGPTQSIGGVIVQDSFIASIGKMRTLANVLYSDSFDAAQQMDTERLAADIESIDALGAQLHADHPLVAVDLTSIGIRLLATKRASQSIDLVTDVQLKRWLERFGRETIAADFLGYDADRALFADHLQRIYTDDGHGDGRITRAGFESLIASTPQPDTEKVFKWLVQPVLPFVMASRSQVIQDLNRVYGMCGDALQKPLRDVDVKPYRQFLQSSGQSPLQHAELSAIVPSLERMQASVEILLGSREGFCCAAALELYRRDHGGYPTTLHALLPAYLKAIPADRITGDPVKFLMKNGQPVIYSVGADRVDNGGVPPMLNGEPYNYKAISWSYSVPTDAPHGDWILYPVDY